MTARKESVPLSRERIVAAAVGLADAGGFRSLSMRNIAEELGAGTMALYRHVANKEDLLDDMVDVVFAENTDSTTLADQLASEAVGRGDLRIEVVRLYTDALGAPGTGADTYVGMLRVTAALIHAALASA